MTPTGTKFYETHHKDEEKKGTAYTHSMIYSPNVVIMRNEFGEWDEPYAVGMVTSAAVNAGVLRQRVARDQDVDALIEGLMRERMGRILGLFKLQGRRTLVLGSFGTGEWKRTNIFLPLTTCVNLTGVFRNSVSMVAAIWADLLKADGPYDGVFEEVTFAILGRQTYDEFRTTFHKRLNYKD